MLKINNVAIPTPSKYTYNRLNVTKNSERNANGDLVTEFIASKRKVEVTWDYLTQDEWKDLLAKISGASNFFFTFEYFDGEDGALKTGTFYAGDRRSEAIDYQGGEIRWRNLSISFVER